MPMPVGAALQAVGFAACWAAHGTVRPLTPLKLWVARVLPALSFSVMFRVWAALS